MNVYVMRTAHNIIAPSSTVYIYTHEYEERIANMMFLCAMMMEKEQSEKKQPDFGGLYRRLYV